MSRKSWAVFLLGVLAVAVLTGLQFVQEELPAGSWGLHFEEPGKPPRGPADAETLREYQGAYLGNPEEKVLYLTFDAGYENGNTGKILDVLREHRVPAAFFVVGSYIDRNPDLVRRMKDEGHIVGNHTMHHYDMSRLSDPEVFAKELTDVEDRFRQVTGREPDLFYRPPQGIYSRQNLEAARDRGYKTVFWSLAYVDWDPDRQPSREEALKKLLPRTHSGAVILLHATSRTNAEILDELLTRWEEEGYSFGTLYDLFGEEPR